MHTICDACFKMAGPLEELSIGTLSEKYVSCAYCGETRPANTVHRLRGDTINHELLPALGFKPTMVVMVRAENDGTTIIHVRSGDQENLHVTRISPHTTYRLTYDVKRK